MITNQFEVLQEIYAKTYYGVPRRALPTTFQPRNINHRIIFLQLKAISKVMMQTYWEGPSEFHTGGAPALRPGAIAQSPGREAALCRASLPKACPASSVRAREGAGCGSVGDLTGASAQLSPSLRTQEPGVLAEGLGAGGVHTAKASLGESSFRGKGRL